MAGQTSALACSLYANLGVVDQPGRKFFCRADPKQTRGGVHRSTRQLEQAIRHYINTVDGDPKPLRWTRSADHILASIKRSCLATLKVTDNQAKSSKLLNQDTRVISVNAGRWLDRLIG